MEAYLKNLSREELVAIRSNLYRSIRQEEAAMGGRDLRSEIAAANCRTLKADLEKVEKVCRKRRIK